MYQTSANATVARPPTSRTSCVLPNRQNRPNEQILSSASDAAILADLLVALRELNAKHMELNDKILRVLERRLRIMG